MKLPFALLTGLLCLTPWMAAWAEPPGKPGVVVRKRTEQVEWEVTFPEDITSDEYARQLDYFKIEIAAMSKNGHVEYIKNVGQRKPNKRAGEIEADYRLRIGWKSGALHAIDRKLLRKAGIGSDQKELWHFFPVETQNLMEQVERAHAKRDRSELKRTRFEIHPTKKPGAYEFVVIEQDPPPPKKPATPDAPDSQNKPETNTP